MAQRHVSRRTMLKSGGAALAGFSVMQVAGPAEAFPGGAARDELVPWIDERGAAAGVRKGRTLRSVRFA